MDEFKRDLSVAYVCENCNKVSNPPIHCGKPMKIQVIQGNISWVCWKGEHPPCCGKTSSLEFNNCCDDPLLVIEQKQIIS